MKRIASLVILIVLAVAGAAPDATSGLIRLP